MTRDDFLAAGSRRLKRLFRILGAGAGLLAVTALDGAPEEPESPGGARAVPPRALILSDQAERFLTLQYRSFPTEFMGCMIGRVQGRALVVERIAPADVDPAQSTSTWVVPRQTCERAGWKGTVGMIHSHPGAERCWYFFPTTQVLSSDGTSFLRASYPVDAILCGDRVVWINRAMVQRDLALTPRRSRE